MTVAKIDATDNEGLVILSGDDPTNKEVVAGGFYPVSISDELYLSFYTVVNGTSASVNLHLDFDTVETIRNQLDVWVVKHWPQE